MNCTRCEIREAKYKCKDCAFQYLLCNLCCEFIHSSEYNLNHRIEETNYLSNLKNNLENNYTRMNTSNDGIFLKDQDYCSYKNTYLLNNKIERSEVCLDNFINSPKYETSVAKKYEHLLSKNMSVNKENEIATERTKYSKANKTQIENNEMKETQTQFLNKINANNDMYIHNLKEFYSNEIQNLNSKIEFLNETNEKDKQRYEQSVAAFERAIYQLEEERRIEILQIEKKCEEKVNKSLGDKEAKIKYLNAVIDDYLKRNNLLTKENEALTNKIKLTNLTRNDVENTLRLELENKEIELEEINNLFEIKNKQLEEKNNLDKSKLTQMNEKVMSK